MARRKMTLEKATETFGPIVFETSEFELRAKVDSQGLHAYAFVKDAEGRTIIPLGFMRGSSSLLKER